MGWLFLLIYVMMIILTMSLIYKDKDFAWALGNSILWPGFWLQVLISWLNRKDN